MIDISARPGGEAEITETQGGKNSHLKISLVKAGVSIIVSGGRHEDGSRR